MDVPTLPSDEMIVEIKKNVDTCLLLPFISLEVTLRVFGSVAPSLPFFQKRNCTRPKNSMVRWHSLATETQ